MKKRMVMDVIINRPIGSNKEESEAQTERLRKLLEPMKAEIRIRVTYAK